MSLIKTPLLILKKTCTAFWDAACSDVSEIYLGFWDDVQDSEDVCDSWSNPAQDFVMYPV